MKQSLGRPSESRGSGLVGKSEGIGAARLRKRFLSGTHRSVSPRETCARLRPLMPVMGITRVANVTGLDCLDIPVVIVCRPNSRSLAVSQGKGVTLDAARASGLMESVELWHAEHIAAPLRLATFDELRLGSSCIDVWKLPRLSVSRFHARLPILWIEGLELLSGERRWVPYEMVHMSFTLPLPTGSGSFVMSSNGLASGNHGVEATSCAICELIERDASSVWLAAPESERDVCRLDPTTVDDPICKRLLQRFAAAEIEVGIWDTTTDIGIASFYCLIVDRSSSPLQEQYTSGGMGCHPAREIALARALTEAAQTRVTFISGARDDREREVYEQARNPEQIRRYRQQILSLPAAPRSFQEVPTFHSDDLEEDLTWALERLRAAGIEEVVTVDLSRPELEVPVVRAIIPGLEANHEVPGYAPGPRARAAASRAGR